MGRRSRPRDRAVVLSTSVRTPAAPAPRHPGTRRRRVLAALVGPAAALVTGLLLALRIGLLAGPLVGVGDNADGFRLFCTAGLAPATPEGNAAWRGVVVTGFTTGHPTCGVPTSSAGLVLAATVGTGPTWSLSTLAAAYVALIALGVGLAVAALTVAAPRRAVLAAVPVLPLLVVPWWTRFAASTYAEPAGLLGTVWVLLGLVVVAASAPKNRRPRLVALLLLVGGGLVAATAKPGFVPVGVVAALACAVVVLRGPTRAWRAAGPVAAVLLVALAAAPVADALRFQDAAYGAINTHNLVFTALLPELVPSVTERVGLPPAAAARTGESFYWAGARDVPGWEAAIGDRPGAARADADAVLADHPAVVATMIGRGLTATLRPQLSYLPSAPRGTAPERNEVRTVYPEAGPLTGLQLAWLAAIPLGWLPAAAAGLAVLAGLATLRPRRRPTGPRPVAVGLVRTGAVAAALAVALVALAVVGDGYYELTKHVWLASFLLATAVLLDGAALLDGALATGVSRARRAWRPGPRRTGAGTDR